MTASQFRLLGKTLLVAAVFTSCHLPFTKPHELVETYTSLPYDPLEWEESYLFDDQGTVVVDYKKDIGVRYNPATIAQYALVNHNKYLETKNHDYERKFLRQIDYLLANYVPIDRDKIGYKYDFYMKEYDLHPPWYSAIAQGNVLSALVRAYHHTRDNSLLPIIQKTKNYLISPTSEGGFRVHTPEGYIWLEEYPSKKPSFVLNGFIFALIGLYDYLSIYPNDQEVIDLTNACITSFKETIHHYDTGSGLKYDRYNESFLVNERYLDFQSRQNIHLYQQTGDRYFLRLYNKWLKYRPAS